MSEMSNELIVELNAVHREPGVERFYVRLDASPIEALIKAAQDAQRLHELLLIERPGDIWAYVWVVLENVPPSVPGRLKLRNTTVPRWLEDLSSASSTQRVTFSVFDSIMVSGSEDEFAEEDAWLSQWTGSTFSGFANDLLEQVNAAKRMMQEMDPLLAHVVDAVASNTHPYCNLSREVVLGKSRTVAPKSPVHSEAFYEKLKELLGDSDVNSVAYRADGDYQVFRMMATEQRRRANLLGKSPRDAFQLSALVNLQVDPTAWDCQFDFYGEGIGYGDLFVDGGGLGDGRLRLLMAVRGYAPRRFLLASQDQGEISGFGRELGDGWTLYRNLKADIDLL